LRDKREAESTAITIEEPPADARSAICADILDTLPSWFGIDAARRQYVSEAAGRSMLIARFGSAIIGFLTTTRHAPGAWEIHAMGVRPEWHRQGIGRRLLAAAEAALRQQRAEFLSVKTLSPRRDDDAYGRTRCFYRAMGFRPLMELPTLWSAENPCLVMIKPLASPRPARRFTDRRLVIASHNPGKAREIGALLAPFDVAVISAAALNLPEPEETGATFIANAELKAQAAATAAALPALADDSGLVVEALDGAPGIFSARWAGPDKDFATAMKRVEDELQAKATTNRRAHFIAALTLCWPDGHCESFEGRVDGTLVWPPRGGKGFGYDPVFVPDGHRHTFGEMEPAAKHAISHRADAFRQLTAACFAR
jgi:XTP/dITP diphosphohydrolase